MQFHHFVSGETLSLQSGDDSRNVALMTSDHVDASADPDLSSTGDAITVPDEDSSSALSHARQPSLVLLVAFMCYYMTIVV